MKDFYKILTIFSFFSICSFSFAHSFIQKPNCLEPSIPYELVNDEMVNEYNQSVSEYKDCLNQFIDEQKSQIKNHHDSAINAQKSWSDFIKKQEKLLQ